MPFDRRRYPDDWKAITLAIRERAGDRCECEGECGRDHAGRCRSERGYPNPDTGSRVVITVAHLWRGPCAECHAVGRKCGEPSHLKAMCQACHLAYDLPQHQANARRTRRARKAAGDLFDPPASGV